MPEAIVRIVSIVPRSDAPYEAARTGLSIDMTETCVQSLLRNCLAGGENKEHYRIRSLAGVSYSLLRPGKTELTKFAARRRECVFQQVAGPKETEKSAGMPASQKYWRQPEMREQ